ncbi:MAG: bifunctional folylpolyglutamate synthase/dihydrofolate synthase [Dethiobacter sp.]|nr:bifunctional folylpolyglutamate synthase/dihydrofolate synthase [Dethiobacter sp.]
MVLEQKYLESLEWIHSIGRFGIKPGLERIYALMERLGNPHHHLKFLHIGGTNGKGSTAAVAASVLQAAGYQTALYTSPFLLSFTNRMALNGQDIAPAELVEIVAQIRPLVAEISADPRLGQMTEFEVVTALALTYFARRKPDIVVFEVGLGGRLDATNLVIPLVSVITNVNLEHTAILGNTVREIAREKAGIVKSGAPLVTAAEDEETLAVLEKKCRDLESPLYRVLPANLLNSFPQNSVGYSRRKITVTGQFFSYRGLNQKLDDLFLPLRGHYQVINAASALAAVELICGQGFMVSEGALRRGLARTAWPGRLEQLSSDPFVILDGAHNPAAARQLAAAVSEYFQFKRLILVLGIMADKDIQEMLRELIPLADEVVLTRPSLSRAADPVILAGYIRQIPGFDKRVHVESDLSRALTLALSLASRDDAVLITGSLYTISEAKGLFKDYPAVK